MTTFTWTGAIATRPNYWDWATPGNWTNNGGLTGAPVAGADVVIDTYNEPYITGPVPTLNSVTVGSAGLPYVGLVDQVALTISGTFSLLNSAVFYEEGVGSYGALNSGGSSVYVFGTASVTGQVSSQAGRFVIEKNAGFSAASTSDTATSWDIQAGATVAFTGTVSGSGDTFGLDATGATLDFGAQGTAFHGSIQIGVLGATIDLGSLAYDPAATITGSSGGPWSIVSGAGTVLFTFVDIQLYLDAAAAEFAISDDGHGGTKLVTQLAPVPVTWTGTNAQFGTGSWSDPGNWDVLTVPGAGALVGKDVVLAAPTATSLAVTAMVDVPGLVIHDLTISGALSGAATVFDQAGLTVTGKLHAAAYGNVLEGASGTIGDAGAPSATAVMLDDHASLSVESGTLTVHGVIAASAAIIDVGQGGKLLADGAHLTNGTSSSFNTALGQYVSGSSIAIHDGATLDINGLVSADPYTPIDATHTDGSVVVFDGTGGNDLVLGAAATSFAPLIANFAAGDTIDLPWLTFNAQDRLLGANGGAFTVADPLFTPLITFARIDLQSGGPGGLALQADTAGGTEIVVGTGNIPASSFAWTGAAGTTNWADAGNWTPSGVPGEGVNAGAIARITVPGANVGIGNLDPARTLVALAIAGGPGGSTQLYQDGSLTITGALNVGASGFFESYSIAGGGITQIGDLANPGAVALSLADGAALDLTHNPSDSSQASITVHGMVQSGSAVVHINGGTFTADAAQFSNGASWSLDNGAIVDFTGPVFAQSTAAYFAFRDDLVPLPNKLVLAQQGPGFAGMIYNFGSLDAIDLASLPYAAADSIAGAPGGPWTISNGAGQVIFTFAKVTLADIAQTLHLYSDGHGGTVIATNPAAAQDGPIAGATVFADANKNGVLDPGEASTITDANGQFTPPSGGPLVLQGGTDTSTTLPFTGQLSAPAGASVITPLTTLVQALLASGAAPNAAAAEQAVAAALGLTLPGAATLDTYNPLAGTLAGAPGAAAIYAAGAAVMDTIILAGAALAELDPGQTTAGAQASVVKALAAAIAANPPGPIDLTNATTLASLVLAAARPGAPAPDATQTGQIATLIAASNAKLQQASGAGSPDAIARFVAQVEYVAQGETAPALHPGADLATVVTGYTGAALDLAVADASANVKCFYPGTSIATPTGERPVESLAIGDLILTAEGETRPILWIGRQTISTRFADPLRTLPIRIRAGALGSGLPARDLLVSPRHALFVDGLLVEAAALVNGATIVRETRVPEIFTYFHIELEDHALILAEGQPAETFVDNASRENFDNWAEHQALFPNGHRVPELALPRAQSCRQLPRALRRRFDTAQAA